MRLITTTSHPTLKKGGLDIAVVERLLDLRVQSGRIPWQPPALYAGAQLAVMHDPAHLPVGHRHTPGRCCERSSSRH
jgi:hypothetical protein